MLHKSFGCARHSFNWALQKWNELYIAGEKPSAFTLVKLQNSIKKDQFPFYLEVNKCAVQYAVHNVADAFNQYFRRLKDGTIERQKSAYIRRRKQLGLPVREDRLRNFGKPRFKSKLRDSDRFVAVENKEQFKQKDNKIRLPRIGWVKCCENLRFEGKVNNVVIKRIADMYFAFVNIEVQDSTPIIKHNTGENQSIIGVDLGIKTLITLSDGTVFENPRALKSNLKSLKRMQRSLSRKVKGSNNRKRQQMKIARKYYRVGNIRSNAIHKATSYVVKNYDTIMIEDLNTSGMMRNHNLAQALSDVSFSEISRQLSYKSAWFGKEVVKVNRFYASSKSCSGCGYKKEKLKLSERTYNCDSCGLVIDRDLNAAINLANYSPTPKSGGCEAFGELSPSSEK